MNDYLPNNILENAEAMIKEAETRRRVTRFTEILSISLSIKAMHVKTRSYAQHMALDETFSALNSALDKFLECVQGYYRRKDNHQPDLVSGKVEVEVATDGGVYQAVKRLEDRFKEASDPLVKGVSPLISLQDDVLNNFYQLYYRLDLK